MKVKCKNGKWKDLHDVCNKPKPKQKINKLEKMVAENFKDLCIIKNYIGG